MFGRSFEEWSRKLRNWYQGKRIKSPPLPEPPNPFSPEQTATLEEILDDVMISSLVAVNDNNDKQLDWCLAITGSIITAVIIAVSLHPASQHPPLLPAFTRSALVVLLLSSGFGVWAKLLLPGDKPFSVSFRSPQLEQLLQRVRPQVTDFSNLPGNERIEREGEMVKKLEYIQFKRYQLEGKVYTQLQRNRDVFNTFFFPGPEDRTSVRFRKIVQFKARLINVQLFLAILGIAAITLGIICRIRI